jgi:hypothetical protein
METMGLIEEMADDAFEPMMGDDDDVVDADVQAIFAEFLPEAEAAPAVADEALPSFPETPDAPMPAGATAAVATPDDDLMARVAALAM